MRQVSVTMVDDLDPTQTADQTVEFGLDGKDYEIDLSGPNATKLRDALALFVASARRAGKSGITRSSTRPSKSVEMSNREQNQMIRQWAKDRGMKVAERGRIDKSVLDAYARRDEPTPTHLAAVPDPAPAVSAPTFKAPKVKTKEVEGEYTSDEVEAWAQSKGKNVTKAKNGTIKGLHFLRAAMVRDKGPKMIKVAM